MTLETDRTGKQDGRPRQRRRLRGMMSGKAGKTIGFTSIAAPIVGYLVNDLRKQDSVVRSLIGAAVRKLLPHKSRPVEAIDITDKTEIITNVSDKWNQSDHND